MPKDRKPDDADPKKTKAWRLAAAEVLRALEPEIAATVFPPNRGNLASNRSKWAKSAGCSPSSVTEILNGGPSVGANSETAYALARVLEIDSTKFDARVRRLRPTGTAMGGTLAGVHVPLSIDGLLAQWAVMQLGHPSSDLNSLSCPVIASPFAQRKQNLLEDYPGLRAPVTYMGLEEAQRIDKTQPLRVLNRYAMEHIGPAWGLVRRTPDGTKGRQSWFKNRLQSCSAEDVMKEFWSTIVSSGVVCDHSHEGFVRELAESCGYQLPDEFSEIVVPSIATALRLLDQGQMASGAIVLVEHAHVFAVRQQSHLQLLWDSEVHFGSAPKRKFSVLVAAKGRMSAEEEALTARWWLERSAHLVVRYLELFDEIKSHISLQQARYGIPGVALDARQIETFVTAKLKLLFDEKNPPCWSNLATGFDAPDVGPIDQTQRRECARALLANRSGKVQTA